MKLITKTYSSEACTNEAEENKESDECESMPQPKVTEVSLGKLYAVYWEPTSYWLLNRAVRIDTNDDIIMEFLHETSADASNFKTKNDIDSVSAPASDVILAVLAPMPVSSSRCSAVKLTEQDFTKIKEAFEKFKET